jgi:drug/metabolite transporter (DMT)-like permease
MMKIAMHDWPPLFARGCAGLAAALGLTISAVVRGQNVLPSRSLASRLALGAAINVFAPMGFTALALLWLTVAQAALLFFSMPIWATLLAWPILGERPRLRSVIALCLGVAGLVLLMGANLGGGIESFPGVARGYPVRPRRSHLPGAYSAAADGLNRVADQPRFGGNDRR